MMSLRTGPNRGYRFHGSRQIFEADVACRRRSGPVAYTSGEVFEARAADGGRARGGDRYRAALTRSRAAAKISATAGSM